MPSFRHKRTGKVVTVTARDAHRYRGSNFEPVPDSDEGGAEPPASASALVPPDGSVVEVLAWAGDDPDRQAAALKAEKAGKNRKGILSALGN